MLGAIITLLLQAATPAALAPPPPDYALASSWATRAGSPGAAAAIAPGATPAAANPAVDVFYINPTSYRSDSDWNQPIADGAANAFTDGSVVARQAGIFNACCRVFAPRYRQASTRAFRAMAAGGEEAFAIAYADVLRAFDHYLRHDNKGRPFILAGHSQGARHIAQLLEDRVDGRALRRRMVVAYVVGIDLTIGEFGARYTTLVPCATPAQTGCVVAWNAILPGADLDRLAAAFSTRYVARFGDSTGKAPFCINPLTFDAARTAAGPDAARTFLHQPVDLRRRAPRRRAGRGARRCAGCSRCRAVATAGRPCRRGTLRTGLSHHRTGAGARPVALAGRQPALS